PAGRSRAQSIRRITAPAAQPAVLRGLPRVALGILLESVPARGRTEIVRLTAELGGCRGAIRLDLHPTDGVRRHRGSLVRVHTVAMLAVSCVLVPRLGAVFYG